MKKTQWNVWLLGLLGALAAFTYVLRRRADPCPQCGHPRSAHDPKSQIDGVLLGGPQVCRRCGRECSW